MWNADRHCFDADPDPDLDQHLKGNSDSGLDPDKHQNDVDPQQWLWLNKKESPCGPGPGFEPGKALQKPGALNTCYAAPYYYTIIAMVNTGRKI
jgi:hypothetical protein